MQCTVSQFLIIQCKRSLLSLFPITLFSNYAYPICVRVFIFIFKILKLNVYFMRILVRMWFIWRKARQSLSFFFWLKKEKEKETHFSIGFNFTCRWALHWEGCWKKDRVVIETNLCWDCISCCLPVISVFGSVNWFNTQSCNGLFSQNLLSLQF